MPTFPLDCVSLLGHGITVCEGNPKGLRTPRAGRIRPRNVQVSMRGHEHQPHRPPASQIGRLQQSNG